MQCIPVSGGYGDYGKATCPCSLKDMTSASEVGDPGSIPGKGTNFLLKQNSAFHKKRSFVLIIYSVSGGASTGADSVTSFL